MEISASIAVEIEDQNVHIKGSIANFSEFTEVSVVAAHPIDRMTTYAGSGLPFPCEDIAFDGTPNHVKLTAASFSCTFKYPNSYYDERSWQKVPPSIFVYGITRTGAVVKHATLLPDPLPLRTLNYRQGYFRGPQFYADKEYIIPLQSAEGTMRATKIYKSQYDAST